MRAILSVVFNHCSIGTVLLSTKFNNAEARGLFTVRNLSELNANLDLLTLKLLDVNNFQVGVIISLGGNDTSHVSMKNLVDVVKGNATVLIILRSTFSRDEEELFGLAHHAIEFQGSRRVTVHVFDNGEAV